MRSPRPSRSTSADEPSASSSSSNSTNGSADSADASDNFFGDSQSQDSSSAAGSADAAKDGSADASSDPAAGAAPDAPDAPAAPPVIDPARSDEDLLAQFRFEAVEHHYAEDAAEKIAQGRLRHLRSGGDGYGLLPAADSDPAAIPPRPPVQEIAGMVPLQGPADASSASHDGEQYSAGLGGIFHVLEKHVAHFLSIGFRHFEG